MRKIIFFLAIALTALPSYAQDIIVTKDAKKIDAKILEVSSSEVRYKELDNLDGPLFTLRMDEIHTIIYANNKVFIPEPTSPTPSSQEVDQQYLEKTIAEIDQVEGYTYTTEGEEIRLKYDFKNRMMYIIAQKPMMIHHSQDARELVITRCHLGDEDRTLVFDMGNKVVGVAICGGGYAFVSNVGLHKYFKKHVPTSFDIEVPYETSQAKYTMTLQPSKEQQ